jgi:hypothetical protein
MRRSSLQQRLSKFTTKKFDEIDPRSKGLQVAHDTQTNIIQHSNIQHSNIQHNAIQQNDAHLKEVVCGNQHK